MRNGGDRRSFMALAAGLSAVATGALAGEMAQGELFVLLYKAGPAWKAGLPMHKQALATHVQYMQGLADAGKLFAGGRFMTSEAGMAIVVAASLEEARAIQAADPAVTTGVFTGEVEHWVPRFRTHHPLPAPPTSA